MIVIVDYGMGNLGSIKNMLKRIGLPVVISGDLREIKNADKLILPGIGSFDNGMQRLQDLGIASVLDCKVLVEKTPVLGICLGMQLMTRSSEEGQRPGLGWLQAETVRFRFDPDQQTVKIPHMGWNRIRIAKDSPLLQAMDEEARFYFAHSYHVVCSRPEDALLYTTYGYEFVAGFQYGHIVGVQFHPEKSHKFGMRLLGNFAEVS